MTTRKKTHPNPTSKWVEPMTSLFLIGDTFIAYQDLEVGKDLKSRVKA